VIGAIIGKAGLVDVVALDAPGASLSILKKTATKHGLSTKAGSMEHVCGPVCFLLTNPKPLVRPIPCGGKLNIWKKEFDPALLRFGQPEINSRPKPTRQKQPTKIGVGSRVNYKRANFYVVEIDEEQIGVAKRRNGPVEDWFEESELELGWFG
jgi:hypothetical protein